MTDDGQSTTDNGQTNEFSMMGMQKKQSEDDGERSRPLTEVRHRRVSLRGA